MTQPEQPPPGTGLNAEGQSGALALPPKQPTPPGGSVEPTGRRQAFRDIRRQLADEELSTPGVQKLILEELDRAEAQCELLQIYVERFHEADKRAAVLQERVRTVHAVEILFGVGVGLGGGIIGLAPFFWSDRVQGIIALVLGTILIVGAVIARAVKR